MIEAATRTTVIALREHETTVLSASLLEPDEAREITERFGKIIAVEWPSGGNGNCWRLRPGGTVGIVRLRSGRTIEITSKVPIANIFRMLELARGIEITRLEEQVEVSSIDDLFRRLAVTLARGVERRRRIGLHRDYVSRTDRLPVVRGRLDLAATLSTPWRVAPVCDYQDQTSDVIENRILSWTLDRILRLGIFSVKGTVGTGQQSRSDIAQDRRTVMSAYRGIVSSVPPREVLPSDCTDREYTRLTADYRPLHALCRFFLEATGPVAQQGGHDSFSFLVDIERLFESYVGTWLAQNRPGGLFYSMHERQSIGTDLGKSLDVDIVARREPGGQVVSVLDTKYKRHRLPSNADLYQIVSYASHFGTTEAWLIYPTAVDPFDVVWGASEIRVRTVGIDLGGEGPDFPVPV